MNSKVENIQKILDNVVEKKQEVKILEAGCGLTSALKFDKKVHLTGIDISANQLQRNTNLQKSILGDIQYYEYIPSSFDVIICWDVLEHLLHPELALRKFVSAIKKDGLIILSLPNVNSIKGFITKYTPFYFHLWYYKNMLGRSISGNNAVGPFKTYLKRNISPNAIKQFAFKNGLQIVYFRTNDVGNMPYWREKSRMARMLINIYNIIRRLCKFISFGRIGDSDFVIILQKL